MLFYDVAAKRKPIFVDQENIRIVAMLAPEQLVKSKPCYSLHTPLHIGYAHHAQKIMKIDSPLAQPPNELLIERGNDFNLSALYVHFYHIYSSTSDLVG